VVLFTSREADAGSVTDWLSRHEIDFEQVDMGPTGAPEREPFRQMYTAAGRRGLPLIFVEGELVGGVDAFFAHPRLAVLAGKETPERVRHSARWLGYLGVLPFAGCALLVLFGRADLQAFALRALLAYGAVILSFVGALHWARALQAGPAAYRARLLIVSVVPSLLAWLALLLPDSGGLLLLSLGFVLLYLFDRREWRAHRWFVRLRLHLSVAATLALAAGAAVAAGLL
jgi:hypothetical protein